MKKREYENLLEEAKTVLPLNLQFFAKDSSDDSDDNNDDGDDDNDDSDDDDDPDDNDDSDDADSKGGKNSSKKEKTFTQAQVTRMMATEKRQGKNSILKELGIDPKDTKQLSALKTLVGALGGKSADSDGSNDEKLQELNEKALKAEIKASAVGLGVKRENLDDIAILIMAKSETEEMSEENISALIGEYKTKYPSFFTKSGNDDDEGGDGKEGKNKKGTGSSVSNKSTKGKKGKEKLSPAQRIIANKKASSGNIKKSFWD